MTIDPYTQRQKCRPMTLVFGNIRYMRILAGVPVGGTSNESGVVDDGNFGDLIGYFFGKFKDKANNIMAICYPLLACD